MHSSANNKWQNETEKTLASLMQAVVEARSRLDAARIRLHSIEEKLRGTNRDKYERQRNQALSEYRDAIGGARQARTNLLKQLRERMA